MPWVSVWGTIAVACAECSLLWALRPSMRGPLVVVLGLGTEKPSIPEVLGGSGGLRCEKISIWRLNDQNGGSVEEPFGGPCCIRPHKRSRVATTEVRPTNPSQAVPSLCRESEIPDYELRRTLTIGAVVPMSDL